MIDLGGLMNFLAGVGISALIFLVVESIIKVTTIQDNNQKSNLYIIALLSCFSSILYAPFLLNVQIHGGKLVLFLSVNLSGFIGRVFTFFCEYLGSV